MLVKASIGFPNYKFKSVALALLCALGSGYERRHIHIFLRWFLVGNGESGFKFLCVYECHVARDCPQNH